MTKLSKIFLLTATLLTGCATTSPNGSMDNKTVSTATGAALGCLGGAVLAKITSQNATSGCAVGAVAGGFIGFEKARREEIAAAAQARQEVVALITTLPSGQSGMQVRAGEVKTIEVTATDKSKSESHKYQAFDSVSVDIPASSRGTVQYNKAIGKLQTLAERIADNRGSSRIEISMTSADARASKVNLETTTARTSNGNPVIMSIATDNSIPRGVERFTVRAGSLKSLSV